MEKIEKTKQEDKGITKQEDREEVFTKKQEEMHKYRISLWLDKYTDLFSDFDPRPFSERAISQDFLEEAERASRDKASGKIELNLLMPAAQRVYHDEVIIKKRLKEFFKRHYNDVLKKKKGIISKGIYFIAAGILLMFMATYIFFTYEESLLTTFLGVLFEPGGWFFFWEGLSQIIFDSKKLNRKLNFHKKMSKSDISFYPYI